MLSPIQNKVGKTSTIVFKRFLDLFKRVFGKPVNEESLRRL